MAELLVDDDDSLRRLKKYREDLEWFQHDYADLKRKYKGEYIAVEDKVVIAHNEDLELLLSSIKDKDMTKILIEHVNESQQMYVL